MSTKHTIAGGDLWRVYRADFGHGPAHLEIGLDCDEIEIPDEVADILAGRAERQVAAVRERCHRIIRAHATGADDNCTARVDVARSILRDLEEAE
jgi:chromosomal replication initiation ATPase DnaA